MTEIDPCQVARGWTRMNPIDAEEQGYRHCPSCDANYEYAVEHKRDVIVDLLSKDIIGVCMDGHGRPRGQVGLKKGVK